MIVATTSIYSDLIAGVAAILGTTIAGVVVWALQRTFKNSGDISDVKVSVDKLYEECRAERKELLDLFDSMINGRVEDVATEVKRMRRRVAEIQKSS